MSKNSWWDEQVRCPLYKFQNDRSIVCEGCVGVNAENRFPSGGYRDKHYEAYCCGDYERCLQYQGVCAKYR